MPPWPAAWAEILLPLQSDVTAGKNLRTPPPLTLFDWLVIWALGQAQGMGDVKVDCPRRRRCRCWLLSMMPCLPSVTSVAWMETFPPGVGGK